MQSLGATPDDELRQQVLHWAYFSGQVKTQDIYFPIGSIASDARGGQLAWAFYRQHFERIKEKLSNAFPALMDAVIVNTTSRFCTVQQADEVELFFRKHPLPSSERRIQQQLELIRSAGNSLFALPADSPLMDVNYWHSLCS